jgi:hypothetical protein
MTKHEKYSQTLFLLYRETFSTINLWIINKYFDIILIICKYFNVFFPYTSFDWLKETNMIYYEIIYFYY